MYSRIEKEWIISSVGIDNTIWTLDIDFLRLLGHPILVNPPPKASRLLGTEEYPFRTVDCTDIFYVAQVYI